VRARIIERISGAAVGEIEAETTYGLWMALLDWGEGQGVPRFTVPAHYRTERVGETADSSQPAPPAAPATGESRAARRGRRPDSVATETHAVMEAGAPAVAGMAEPVPTETLEPQPATDQAGSVHEPPPGSMSAGEHGDTPAALVGPAITMSDETELLTAYAEPAKRPRRRSRPAPGTEEMTARPRRKAPPNTDGAAGATTKPAEQLRLF
jgi:hypothetical protein